MAAPVATPRTIPTGWKMPEGFKSLITFSENPAIKIWEKTVKPPAVDSGDPIDTTTMHNVRFRTKQPRSLLTTTDSTFSCAYDPDVLTEIIATTGLNQTITVTFPDHSTLAFYGFLQKFEPGELKDGEFPEATSTVVPTNWDPINNVEAGPVFTAAPGT